MTDFNYTQAEHRTVIDRDSFTQDKLLNGIHSVIVNNGNDCKAIRVGGYTLPDYDAFEIRQHNDYWILSIGGKLISYGSYTHIIDVMVLLATTYKCYKSKTSLIYFLHLPNAKQVIDKIVKLRELDHTKMEQKNVNQ